MRAQVKFENSMHNYNATQVHRHHTLGCQCSSFGSYAVHKVVPVRLLIAKKCNYFMTSLRGKMRLRLNLKTVCTTTMSSKFIDITHLGWQCSSFGSYAVPVAPFFFNLTGPVNTHAKTEIKSGQFISPGNKATRSPEISREQVQKLTPQFFFYIYIGYRFPLSLSTIVFLKNKKK